MKRVVILQDYVPTYRRPFFEELIRLGKELDIAIEVAAGQPSGAQAQRNDDAEPDFVVPLNHRELRMAGKRLVWRRTGQLLQTADLVILEQARRNLDAYRLLGWRTKGLRVALWGHGKDFVQKPGAIAQVLQKSLTRRCDWFFAYTESGAKAVAAMGFPQGRITVVRNSIDTKAMVESSLTIGDEDIVAFRESLKLTNNVAVFVGGLDESKRIPFLISAARAAYAIDDSFRLLIVGDGPERDVVEEEAQRSEPVIYAGPLAGREKILALLSSRVIAMPGRVGLIAVDSFASGRPIVTTDWPWHAPEFDYLSDDITAKISNDDPLAYAQCLTSLMGDNERLSAMQRNCLMNSAEYTIESMARRYIDGISQSLATGLQK